MSHSEIAAALATFIRSGSANGREGLPKQLLAMVPLFAAAPDLLELAKYAYQHCNPTEGREAEWDRLCKVLDQFYSAKRGTA